MILGRERNTRDPSISLAQSSEWTLRLMFMPLSDIYSNGFGNYHTYTITVYRTYLLDPKIMDLFEKRFWSHKVLFNKRPIISGCGTSHEFETCSNHLSSIASQRAGSAPKVCVSLLEAKIGIWGRQRGKGGTERVKSYLKAGAVFQRWPADTK